MTIYNHNTDDFVIELDERDKWWLKLFLEKENINLNEMMDDETIEIEYFIEDDFYYPSALFNEKVDKIEEYSVEKIKEILESKSRVRNKFHYTFL